ncbi:hypothetical protein [Curtobacterium sp. MCSS17_016]|uniref:hypothetical protein n=1 Tax=Curtobacterium sp. MCSS17_016 TaxID=2175644 RepID=UPI000DA8A8F5|nr:hypothetical protein [Curtobacterium sp. MCSS17_016]WIE80982.1 hypothetical protein DEJ19_020915 [Curtobacterium sp. MCSS17_016]
MLLEAPLTEDQFVLSETELREVVQATVAACYSNSTRLGVAADHWAGTLFGETLGTPPLTAVAAVLGVNVTSVEDLLHDVRVVGRLVHEQETGLPAPW